VTGAATVNSKYTVNSVARALALIETFVEPPHVFSLAELARRRSMTKNQAFRLMRTIEASGVVERSDDRYRLGTRLFEIAQFAARRPDLVALASPVMHRLHAATGEQTIYLLIRSGVHALCVHAIQSRRVLRLVVEPGDVRPLHAGAGGKVLLAHANQDVWQAVARRGLARFTDATVTDRRSLRADLDRIRRQGWAISEGEIVSGSAAVAAPVSNAQGAVVASLAVGGLAEEVGSAGRRLARQTAVVAAAAEISRGLGHVA
jgi:DNA-binding IclR family transcriptional regulator